MSSLIEVGHGDGRILTECSQRDPLMAAHGIDVRNIPIDAGWRQITAQWDPVSEQWLGADIPLGDTPQLVIAVEWLDDLPGAVIVAGDGEAIPGATAIKALTSAEHTWLARWWPNPGPGERAVIGHQRDRAWRWWATRLAPGSVLATLDYGHLANQRPRDGGLSAHRHGERVRPGPGTNVTASVAIDAVASAVEAVGAQRLLCARLMDLPDSFWTVEAQSPLDALALRSQIALLRDPERFGQFWLVAHRIVGAGHP
ncbi:MAG: hypothetical protein Q4G46_07565 [Propionibacteriaceae bacterium]|nr:hypothetical protein [Propionibacteriaceae bacterium]